MGVVFEQSTESSEMSEPENSQELVYAVKFDDYSSAVPGTVEVSQQDRGLEDLMVSRPLSCMTAAEYASTTQKDDNNDDEH